MPIGRTLTLSEERIRAIQEKIDREIGIRRARVDPTSATRPGVLYCLENLTNPRLVAAIIDEPIEEVEEFVRYQSREQLKKKLSSLLKRAMSLPVKSELQDEFYRILAVNLDAGHSDWVSDAQTVEALLEIAEALAAGEKSEKVAAICSRVAAKMTPQKMQIVLGGLES